MIKMYKMRLKSLVKGFLSLLFAATATHAGEALTYDEAMSKALQGNSQIRAAEKEREATGHGIGQAEKRLNPELALETEDFGGSLVGLKLTQPFELGGKRRARIESARTDSINATAGLVSAKAAVAAETYRRFYKALGYKEQITQIDSLIAFADSTRLIIERLVTNGRVGKTELLRSVKDIALLRIERNTLVLSYQNSLTALGALWNAPKGAFASVSGTLHGGNSVPYRDNLASFMEKSPAMQVAKAEVEAAKAKESVEQAQGMPDLSVTGGFVRDGEAGENRVALGAAVGLPVFNRNKGAVTAAKSRTEAAEARLQSVRSSLEARLLQDINLVEQLEFRADGLKKSVIPQTGEVLTELRRLFEAGKSGYAEMITAQRELIEVWRDYLNTETEIRLVLANLLEQTGQ